MSNPIVHKLGDYTVAQVGPDKSWEFNGDNGQKIAMKTYSVQFEGIADWVDHNVKADGDAPKVGEVLRGHVEDTGKFGLRFKKESKGGGNWSGGGKGGYTPGAAWSAAFEVASTIVTGYFTIADKKPKNIKEFLGKIEEVAVIVKGKVDGLAASDTKKDEPKPTESESGESPAPADNGVEIEDVSEDELGSW